MTETREGPEVANRPQAFPLWGSLAIPAGFLWGTLIGVALGALFGNLFIGGMIGAGLGLGIGLTLFAAAIVVVSRGI